MSAETHGSTASPSALHASVGPEMSSEIVAVPAGGSVVVPGSPGAHSTASRVPHSNSFRFGLFLITWSASGAGGRWMARCPYHALNDKTDCTKTMMVKPGSSDDQKDRAKLAVMWWCLQAQRFGLKRDHGALNARQFMDECPYPENVLRLRANACPDPPTKQELMTDEFLDAVAAAGGGGGGEDGAKRPRGDGEEKSAPAKKSIRVAPSVARSRQVGSAASSSAGAVPAPAGAPVDDDGSGGNVQNTPPGSSSSSNSSDSSSSSSSSSSDSDSD